MSPGEPTSSGESPPASPAVVDRTVLRVSFIASLSAALEPCGCRAGMLGGIDHAAALLERSSSTAPSLLLAAGATLFAGESGTQAERRQQALKAETLARALADMKLAAWTPGLPDLAAGTSELARLSALLGSRVLAANAGATALRPESARVLRTGGVALGVAGVVLAARDRQLPAGVQLGDAAIALERAHGELARSGSELELALIAGPRESALALLEQVPGFELALIAAADAYAGAEPEPDAWPSHVGGTRVLAPRGALHELVTVDIVRKGASVLAAEPHTTEVHEGAGSHPAVAARIASYHAELERTSDQLLPAQAPEPHGAYAGVDACASCHDAAHVFWNNTGHARAYFTLVDRKRTHDLDCVPCHVTGYEPLDGARVSGLHAVQCEVCHGPGAEHARTGARDSITLTPERSLCRSCHRPPHVLPSWDLEAAWRHTLGLGHGSAR